MDLKKYYNGNLKDRSRYLRKHMTKAEEALWFSFLRGYIPRVHRQRPMANFIVDFYIPKAGLVIEIDGDSHFQEGGKQKDKMRDLVLKNLNLEVLRFTNNDIFQSFDAVREEIHKVVQRRLYEFSHTPPSPL